MKKTTAWAAPAEESATEPNTTGGQADCAEEMQCHPCDSLPEPYFTGQPKVFEIPQKRTVRVIEYDMEEFFQSCVDLYAELTDTNPANYPAVVTPFGIEHTDLEDGQGGPRGEISSPSMEALANLLGIDAPMGPPDMPVIVGGQPLDEDDPNPLPPSESG